METREAIEENHNIGIRLLGHGSDALPDQNLRTEYNQALGSVLDPRNIDVCDGS